MDAQWETVVGVELHVQLDTDSKIFSGASTAYGAEPNRQACAVDLAMPGTLPVLNREVVTMAVKLGHAINAEIAPVCVFARKNYFYPDLPKGYQISQYEQPIVGEGYLDLHLDDDSVRRIGIVRAHLEEDAGKSIHDAFRGQSAVDLNRAGTPLLEIVTAPDLRSAHEAAVFMREMHTLVRYLGICDGNLQEGSFRCDANVSVRRRGDEKLGTRAEIKNMNSFRFVERAIDFEVHRQIHLLECGDKVVQETRLYDPDKNETRSMRGKEEAEDYRYFPDPDLLPVRVDEALVAEVKQDMPELPADKRERYMAELGLGLADAGPLVSEPDWADFFEQVMQHAPEVPPKRCANWVLGELMGALHKMHLSMADSPVSPEQLAGLLKRIEDGSISGKIAKSVFDGMLAGEGDADRIIEARGLKQISDRGSIETVIDKILAGSPDQVAQFQAGEQKVFNFFVGQVMKETRGQANPAQVRDVLTEKLNNS